MNTPTKRCNGTTEVFSRVTGFYRPVQQWNKGKRQEYSDRREYRFEAVRPNA